MNKLSIRPSSPAQPSKGLEMGMSTYQLESQDFHQLIILIPAGCDCAYRPPGAKSLREIQRNGGIPVCASLATGLVG
jgi:hypothetical protein